MYSQGKIYKLYTKEGDECYIGSTIQPLWRRLQVHKYPTNRCRSRELFEKYKCIEIELLEEYPCNTRYELEAREKEYIKKTDNCINNNKENYVNCSEEVKRSVASNDCEGVKTIGDTKKLADSASEMGDSTSEMRDSTSEMRVLKREKRREFDLQRYNRCPEEARKTKILQKISRVGNIPTEASIDKYNITINDLLKIQEYLGKIDNLENKEKINNKLLKRIKYINNKN
jgi:Sec-independent protein translocase protein TatA